MSISILGAEWERSGRGREVQFFALDEEVDSWLGQYLPDQFRPYILCGFESVRHGRAYEWKKFECDGLTVSPCRPVIPSRTSFWIVSRTVSGSRLESLRSAADYSLNGFIALQHGGERRGLREESRIAFVDKIVQRMTGEVVVHQDYQKMYSALAKGIRSHLVYATVLPGTTIEDDKLALMTEAAAAASADGKVAFTRKPGRRLR